LEALEAGDIALYFYIDQMSRRFTVPSLDLFRTEVEIRLPYFDLEYLEVLLKLPIKKRYEGEVQQQIVSRYHPQLLKVINSNTGAPLNTNLFQRFFKDKFNSLLRRLSMPGYRHYTEFQKWQRQYFKDDMRAILFSSNARQRGIYNFAGLEKIFQAHMNKKINAAAFLGTAVGIELWHREFFDA